MAALHSALLALLSRVWKFWMHGRQFVLNSKTHLFPHLELRGSSYKIGQQDGKHLAPQTIDQPAIYRDLFQEACKFDWAHVRTVAEEFRASIGQLAPHLLQEMEGIADGLRADAEQQWRTVDVLDIIALNARSRWGQWDDGCTSLAWRIHISSERVVLGQNWDWREGVGKNLAMVSIEQEGKSKIWTVPEPGIVGTGNSSSVGVLLTDIRARPISTSLLPIHCLSLESDSVDSAIGTIEKLGGAASSQHILIADFHKARGLELSPRGRVYLPEDANGIVVHTNHFLENKLVDEPPWLSGSSVRLTRAREICGELVQELGDDRVREKGIDAKFAARTLLLRHLQLSASDLLFNGPELIARIQTFFNIVMMFGEGKEPQASAEVVFRKLSSGEESEVFRMSW
ncbi:AAT-domain-containing protein [Ganoderma leucocontextum]|nr:AAT-domain-containing protein [Ganoderma leucocontextum]